MHRTAGPLFLNQDATFSHGTVAGSDLALSYATGQDAYATGQDLVVIRF